jgi:hypothetical protein
MEAETSVRAASPQPFVTRLPTSPACTHDAMQTIRFRHAHFTARLPVDYRYTPSHFWLLPAPAAADEQSPDAQGSSPQAAAGQAATGQGTLWRIGFTKFATRKALIRSLKRLIILPNVAIDRSVKRCSCSLPLAAFERWHDGMVRQA